MKLYITARLKADLLSVARVMRLLRRNKGRPELISFRPESSGAVGVLKATLDYPGSPNGLLGDLVLLPNVLDARVVEETGLNGGFADLK